MKSATGCGEPRGERSGASQSATGSGMWNESGSASENRSETGSESETGSDEHHHEASGECGAPDGPAATENGSGSETANDESLHEQQHGAREHAESGSANGSGSEGHARRGGQHGGPPTENESESESEACLRFTISTT